MKLDDYAADKATHLLECSHCIGSNCKQFDMRCSIVKTMPDGRLKIVVFGELYWKGKDEKKRIRYVEAWRVRPGKGAEGSK